MSNTPRIFELDNGLRVVHRRIQHSRIVHCGFLINTGTRDETAEQNGIAHFIEHMVFKGTKNRRSYHILNRIEAVGGELNAYTSREKTCFYTASLKNYTNRAIDLLADITFNAVFPPKELEKEKRVVLEEIEMYEDTPEENILDKFYEYMFPEHPLGYNILGTHENVRNFTRNDILSFIENNYSPEDMVFSVVGNISPKKIEKSINKFLEPLEARKNFKKRESPSIMPAFIRSEEKDFQQTYCVIGKPAYSLHDPRRHVLGLINNILGGESMNSRLNLGIREKFGYVYQVSSSYSPFTDTGLFQVELATDKKYLEKCISLVFKEYKKLREKKLGKMQLTTAKRQLLGQAAMINENHSIIMQSQAKSLLNYGRVITLDEFFKKIEAITPEDILEVANEILVPEESSILTFKN